MQHHPKSSSRIARWMELRRLDQVLKNRPAPAVPRLVKLDATVAVWRVLVPGQASRFMSAQPPGTGSEKYVVLVDAERFYRAWLAGDGSARRPDRCLVREEMPDDYKYSGAVAGFSQGIGNPVPLAYAGAMREGPRVGIGFTNGITRTFWLLANRAEAFPVMVCGRESAELMHKAAGLQAPMLYEDLFREPRQRQREAFARGLASSGNVIDEA